MNSRTAFTISVFYIILLKYKLVVAAKLSIRNIQAEHNDSLFRTKFIKMRGINSFLKL